MENSATQIEAVRESIERQKAYILELQRIFGDYEYDPLKPGLGEVSCECSRHYKIEKLWLSKVKCALKTITNQRLQRRAIPLAHLPLFIKHYRNPGKRWERARIIAETRSIKKYEK